MVLTSRFSENEVAKPPNDFMPYPVNNPHTTSPQKLFRPETDESTMPTMHYAPNPVNSGNQAVGQLYFFCFLQGIYSSFSQAQLHVLHQNISF
jgi:hypothetical protein